MLTHAAVAAGAAATLLVGALPRLLLAADALPSPFRAFVWSDVLYTWERGLAGGRLPYWDSYFEYPPLIGYLSAAFSFAAGSAVVYVGLWAIVQAASAAVVAAVIARGSGARALWRWALTPQLLLLGAINFDLLALAALAVAVTWQREGGALRSAGALAVGTAAKLFPAAALPVVTLRALGAGGAGRAISAVVLFIVAIAALYAPALCARYSSAESITRYAAGIPANFDSVWGMLRAALEAAGMPAPSAIILAATTIGLVVTYVAAVLPAALRARDPAVPIALAVIALLLWSRLYSPQFSLWVLPFLALLPVRGRTVALLVVADVGVFLSVYPLTLVSWGAQEALPVALLGVLGASVVARHAALLLAWREVWALRDT